MAVLGVAITLRLVLTLTHPGFLGVDGGAYILDSLRTGVGYDFTRPPLAPGWLLWPFLKLFGLDAGYSLFSALGSIALLGPFLLLARRLIGSGWPLMFAGVFFAFDLIHADMLVTGVLPLLGFALYALAIWAILSLCTRWTRGRAAVLVVSVALIAYVNHTTAGIVAITLPVLLAALWVTRKDRGWVKRVGPPLALGVGFAFTALPWYLGVAPGSAYTHFPGPWVSLSSGDNIVWWQTAANLAVAALVLRNAHSGWRLKAVAVLLGWLAILSPFLSNDETIINLFYRSGYMAPVLFYPLVTYLVFNWLGPLVTWRTPAIVATTAALGVMAFGYVWTFQNQAKVSDMVTPEVATVLEALPNDGTEVITNSFMMSLWVSALTGTPSIWTFTVEPPRLWTESDEHVRCILGFTPDCDLEISTQAVNAGWVLVDTRHQIGDKARAIYGSELTNPWDTLPPWLEIREERGTARLYQVVT